MLRAYKTEIKLTSNQIIKINRTMGVCRYLYNTYIAKNKELYEKYQNGEISKKESFMSANDFDKWVNHHLKKQNEYSWIDECGSKARKKAIVNAETAYIRFFNGKSKFPRFKKKKNQDVKGYFPKNNASDWTVERHRIKIPTLGFVRLKEYGYIKDKNAIVKNGSISKKADRYYVSLTVDKEVSNQINHQYTDGVGIDVGVKDFAICSNGNLVFKNINKASKVKKLEKKLKREQRNLSRKYENLKKKGGTATKSNISKQVLKVQKLHQRLTNKRNDYINKVVSEIVKTKPSFITLEDLNVSGMMKNRHLAKAIAAQKFYFFKTRLEQKCNQHNIELRIVDKFYPSSKTCSKCREIKNNLKLSDRVFKCVCGLEIDRDLNAAINLRNAKEYRIV